MWVPGTLFRILPITVIYFRYAGSGSRASGTLAIPTVS
jgi:hypothetical protein